MSRITCTVTNCYYNKRQGCTAPTLAVDGKNAEQSRFTFCDTFIEQKPGIRSSIYEPKADTQIKCDAVKCVYNKREMCDADFVLVNGKNAKAPEETSCSTFKS